MTMMINFKFICMGYWRFKKRNIRC